MRLILPLIALLSIATPAMAQQPDCRPAEDMLAYLASKYDEHPVATGVAIDQKLVMVFTKPDGSTFTVVKVNPEGMACMVDAGQDWQTRNAPAQEQGS